MIGSLLWLINFLTYFDIERALPGSTVPDDGLMSMVWCKT